MKKLILLIVACVALSGCMKIIDPITGQTKYAIDPNAAAKIEKPAETVVSVLGVLGTFWPALLPFATAAVGAVAAWKRIKPKLTEAQTTSNLYHTSTQSLVAAIEEYKKHDPEGWDKLKGELGDWPTRVENVIRALRNMSPLDE